MRAGTNVTIKVKPIELLIALGLINWEIEDVAPGTSTMCTGQREVCTSRKHPVPGLEPGHRLGDELAQQQGVCSVGAYQGGTPPKGLGTSS